MKVGIIGVGAVGASCAKALLIRGSCTDLVLLDVDVERARGVANDLSHGEPLCAPCRVRSCMNATRSRSTARQSITGGAGLRGPGDPRPWGRRVVVESVAEAAMIGVAELRLRVPDRVVGGERRDRGVLGQRQLLPEARSLQVERHLFPRIRALNFVVHGLLGDGVAASLRADPQAKTLGEYLRAKLVPVPKVLLR